MRFRGQPNGIAILLLFMKVFLKIKVGNKIIMIRNYVTSLYLAQLNVIMKCDCYK